MATHTSAAHRVVRAKLVRHLYDAGTPIPAIAAQFKVTPTYVRKILAPDSGGPRTVDEKAVERIAAAHKAYLTRQGYGFFFR